MDECRRHEHVDGGRRETKVRRHHTDHGVFRAVQGDLATDDVRIRSEAAHPQALAHDDDGRLLRNLVRRERAPRHRLQAEDRKQVRRRAQCVEPLGLAVAGQLYERLWNAAMPSNEVLRSRQST